MSQATACVICGTLVLPGHWTAVHTAWHITVDGENKSTKTNVGVTQNNPHIRTSTHKTQILNNA